MYAIRVASGAARAMASLPTEVISKLDEAIRGLADNPRPDGCRKLRGNHEGWRVRVGSYRILYLVDDSGRMVTIYAVGHRRDIYR